MLWVKPNEYITLDCKVNQKNFGTTFEIFFNICYFIENVAYPHYNVLHLRHYVELLKEVQGTINECISEIIASLKDKNIIYYAQNWIEDHIEKLENVTEEEIKKATEREKKINPAHTKKVREGVTEHILRVIQPQFINSLKEDIDAALDQKDKELFLRLSKELNKQLKSIGEW